MEQTASAPRAPKRECGACSLCCKVFSVDWLDRPKPAGKWCHHCQPGKGCRIWQTVPEKCLDFNCDWKTNPELGEAWKPDHCGFVIFRQPMTGTYEITIDPGRPDAWRKKPYYQMLQQAAARLVPNHAMIVRLGWQQWVMLPDGEVEMPPEHRNSGVKFRQESPLFGGKWHVEFIPRPVFG